jgi:hypothetical protein
MDALFALIGQLSALELLIASDALNVDEGDEHG